jgi:L-fuculose-phosphate aldolase
MTEQEIREAIVAACRRMNAIGLNQGTSGNISVRHDNAVLMTPSGIPYDTMRAEEVAVFPVDAPYGTWSGPKTPSTEWRFHFDIMKARPECGAIVHTHATFATTLAMARKEIPACHYMIAAFGGTNVRCSGYATFGSSELAAHAVRALEGRTACLLANHGMIALGASLDQAMWRAVELETIAKQYFYSLQIGGPTLLSDADIAEALAKFSSYGPQGNEGLKKAAAF